MFPLRIICLYMTYEHPPYSLAHLAYFVILCYANMWFHINTHPKATKAERLIWESIDFLMQLPEEERAIMLPVFECGLYWAHPANLLLCMLGDEDPVVQKEALEKVMSLRHSPLQPQPSTLPGRACGRSLRRRASGTPVIPPYQLPKPVYDAPHYSKMIDWSVEQVIATDVWHGVSKGVEDGCRPPALQAGHP